MKRVFVHVMFLLCTIASHASIAASVKSPSLAMGVLPFLNEKLLIENFTPLQKYLEKELGRPVLIKTAPDFRTFIVNTRKGDFDIIVTAPHLALLAEKESRFQRLVTSKSDLHALILVAKDSPIMKIEDLRGKTLHLPSNLSIVSLLTEQHLIQAKLNVQKEVKLIYHDSHNDALLAASRNPNEAAAAGPKILEIMPPEIRDNLRTLDVTPMTPNLVIMAHPRIKEKDTQTLLQALLNFHQSELSRKFFVEEDHLPFRPITDTQMESLEPYQKLLKQRLKK